MKQRGFTLIELIIVIVILGILAVTAAPKFIDIQSDARGATLQGVKASIETAISGVYGKSLIAGNQGTASSATPAPTVTVNNQTITLNFGYPTGTDAQWANLLELNTDEFKTIFLAAGVDTDNSGTADIGATEGALVIYPAGYTAPSADTSAAANDQCFVYYSNELTTTGSKPSIGVVDDEC